MARSFVVVGPDSQGQATAVRATRQLACALRVARAVADQHPGFEVTILETMPSRGTATPRWPIARVRSNGTHREVDWSMA